MKQLIRSLTFAFTALLAGAATAQPYEITVQGHVFPCSPDIANGYVQIMSVQGTQPVMTDTVPLNANCFYTATYMMDSPSGWFQVTGSCGDGTIDNSIGSYQTNGTTLTLDLQCGPPATDCEACFTMEQTAPFTAVFDPSCSTGDEPFLNYVWDLTGGAVQTEILEQTFSGPGNYFICLNIQAGNGCWSGICEDIYVDNDGNVFILNEGCEADFTVEQAVDGNGDPIPFELDITNLSTGGGAISNTWQMPFGETSVAFEPTYTLPNTGQAEVYGICLNITSGNCISWDCDSLYVLADGTLTDPFYFDCEGTVNGPAVVGSPCDDNDQNTENDQWNNNCNCEGTPLIIDCENVPGGPALPGTPCDDDDPMTTNDLWTADCECEGTTAQGPYWVTVTGHISPCSPAIANGLVTISSVQGTSPSFTQTANINSNCYYTATFLMDDLSGWLQVTASCGDGTSDTNIGQYNINMLGGDTIIIDLDCSGSVPLDCEGIPNGPAQPWTPCDDNDPTTINDIWNADCECEGSSIEPGDCEAGYWVIQAYDSTNGQVEPIPFELWVWNLSEGDGNLQFVWDFGDGTYSSDPYPTHIYGSSGPYILCLSMVDATGCTDTYCDTVSVDNDGLLGANGDVRNVLTLNVINPLTTGIGNVQVFEELAVWPNPAADQLTISFNSTITGNTTISIFDLNGRIVRTLNSTFNKGTNTLTIPVADLANGMYSIRIENNGNSIAHRFVKNQ